MIAKQTNLAVVSEDDKETEKPLSPARQALVRAQRRRAEVQATQAEVVRQHRRIEGLTDGGKPAIEAKIAELEKRHAEIFEAWALQEGGAPPEMPHSAEIAALKDKLKHAETVAAGAKAALARTNEELLACQDDCARAGEGVRDAAYGVLVEIAGALAAELAPLEERAALIRGHLLALQRHFELEGYRGRPGGNLSAVVGRMITRGPVEMAPQALNDAVGCWSVLAGRLVMDETAELEMEK